MMLFNPIFRSPLQAMIIAFSTNLIPKIVYAASMGDHELNNYLNFTLAVFNTKDFQVQPLLGGSQHVNETVCRYTEFRNSPTDEHPYKRPMIYWKILTGRLAFIVIYQVRGSVVITIIELLAYSVLVPRRTLSPCCRASSAGPCRMFRDAC